MSRGCAYLADEFTRRESFVGNRLVDGDWIFSNLENIDPAKLREACHAIADQDGVQAYVILRRELELAAGREFQKMTKETH
jgi:hypothetical protein